MSLRAGSLRSRITFQRRSLATDEAGQPAGWEDLPRAVAADIRHAGGLETIKAGAEVSIVRASIRIRRREDVTAGMRAVHTGRGVTTIYEIEAVPPTAPGQDYTDLICKVVR